MSRLRAFTFTVSHDDDRCSLTFYSLTRGGARRYALSWATAHGWTLEGDE